jgi:hypothetical protein
MISLKTERLRDKLQVWFKGPGWYPEDMATNKTTEWQYAKFDPQTTIYVKVMVFLQYWVFVGMWFWLPQAQADLPRSFVLVLFFWSVFSFFVQGVWLDARAYAERLDVSCSPMVRCTTDSGSSLKR